MRPPLNTISVFPDLTGLHSCLTWLILCYLLCRRFLLRTSPINITVAWCNLSVVCKDIPCTFGCIWMPSGSFGMILDFLWGLCVSLGLPLGFFWDPFGHLWPSWVPSGWPWVSLGCLRPIVGRLLDPCGSCWVALGTSRQTFGIPLAVLGQIGLPQAVLQI